MDTKGVGFVVVLVILGLFLGALGFLPTLEHNLAVQESQPVPATVESTDVEVREDDDGDESYNPVVTYVYAVDGEEYRNDNTFPGRFTRWQSSGSTAQSIVDQYAPGDEVVVHYDPSNPATSYLRNDGWPESWFLGAGYAVFAALGGVGLIVTGVRRWKQRQLMVDTPTARIQSLSIGPAEITGKARTNGREPLPAPFSDEACIVAKYEIQQYDEGDDDDDGHWETIEEGTRFMPFAVDDGTGTVRVEPSNEATFDLEPEDWTRTYVDSSDDGPAPIRSFVRAHDDLDFPSTAGGKDNDRRYRQNLIKPDESVYVYGTAQPREVEGSTSNADGTATSNADRLVVTSAEGPAVEATMFMISDDSEADLTDRRAWALWRAPVGGFFVLLAVCFALGIAGPELGIPLPDLR